MSKKNEKTFIGYSPYPWQLAVHNGLSKFGKNSGHIHCVKAKRQIGKSYIIINELLRFAINYSDTVNGCLSPTLNQSRKIYKQILKSVEQTGVLRKKNDSLLEIEFINGSSILFKSAEQRDNLRGYTFSGILCIDEAAYIPDEVYSIIKPSTDVWRCPILMVSTPKFRIGFFYETYNYGLMDKYKDTITSYDLCKYDTSALLSPETLEMYRQTLPRNQFITEYLGDFLDSDSVVFGHFKECISNNINEKYEKLFVGVDWGSGVGGDETVVTALNEFKQQVFLLHFRNKSTTEQIKYIVEYLKPYLPKIKNILCENNGMGKPMVNMLRHQLPKKGIVNEFVTTNKSKTDIVNKLQVYFEQRKIQILDDEQQQAELSFYEAKYNSKTGNITYNAPQGGNDDMCIALMLALQAYYEKNTRGNYNYLIV